MNIDFTFEVTAGYPYLFQGAAMKEICCYIQNTDSTLLQPVDFRLVYFVDEMTYKTQITSEHGKMSANDIFDNDHSDVRLLSSAVRSPKGINFDLFERNVKVGIEVLGVISDCDRVVVKERCFVLKDCALGLACWSITTHYSEHAFKDKYGREITFKILI